MLLPLAIPGLQNSHKDQLLRYLACLAFSITFLAEEILRAKDAI